MKQLSLLDLYYLVDELRASLVNERLDNFYYEQDTLYLKVYVRGKGHWYVVNWVSKALYLSQQKQDASEPDSFVKFLRKYLRNGFIRDVDLYADERIVRFTVERKETSGDLVQYYLFLELFANGNVIVTDQGLTIRNALELRRFRDRKILVRHPYELPPSRQASVFSVTTEALGSMMASSDRQVVKTLATQLGIGGKFAEEACHLSGIEKTKAAASLDEEEIKGLVDTLANLWHQEKQPQAVCTQEGDIKDFLPYPFKSVPESSQQPYDDFSSLLRAYFQQFEKEHDPREQQLQKELQRLQHRLEKLHEQKKTIEEEYDTLNTKGSLIYEHYQELEDLLGGIREAAKTKGWKYVKERIEEEPSLKRWVKGIDEKNNELILELEPAGTNT